MVSRISAPSAMGRPAPPYSGGMSAPEVAGLGQLGDEGLRILAPRVQLAPVLAGIPLADVANIRLEGALLVAEGKRHPAMANVL